MPVDEGGDVLNSADGELLILLKAFNDLCEERKCAENTVASTSNLLPVPVKVITQYDDHRGHPRFMAAAHFESCRQTS